MNKVYEKLLQCCESVKKKTDFRPEVALILGSGLGDLRGGRGCPRRGCGGLP